MAISKSKETKKEMAKTNRRSKTSGAKNTQPTVAALAEGQNPGELVDSLTKNAKNRGGMYEMVKQHAVFSADCASFLKNVSTDNMRMSVPIREPRRLKFRNENDFYSGQFTKFETSDYAILQAPNKSNYALVWHYIAQENTKLVVCLCSDDEMSDSDDSKCYPYFPTQPDQQMVVDRRDTGTFTITCKKREELPMGARKFEFEFVDSEAPPPPDAKASDDPEADKGKVLPLTIYQMHTWKGLKPESGNALAQSASVAQFLQEVNKAEIGIIRYGSNLLAPVVIQSMNAVNRGAITWISLVLQKDVEKRECFDVVSLIRAMIKIRPGVLHTYFQFAFCMAVCLHIGKNVKWCENDCAKALDDLTTKFENRKVNENGHIVVT